MQVRYKKYKLLEMLIQNNFKIEDFGITYNKIPNNLSNLKLDFAIEEDKEIIQNIASGRFDHTRFKDFYLEKNQQKVYIIIGFVPQIRKEL